jgi:hypothetical protein
VKRLGLVLALAAGLLGCNGPTATTVVPLVNGQPINQAKPCDSYVGQTLTKADETINCTLGGSGDQITVQPASTTACDNGQTWISLGAEVGGVEGQKAAKLSADYSLDRASCTAS